MRYSRFAVYLAVSASIAPALVTSWATPRSRKLRRVTSLSAGLDYEYVPPNPKSSSSTTSETSSLPSGYPSDTPSSLRGEAVRSALKSGRCIGWNFAGTPLSHGGIIHVTGEGTLDFVNNKFTQSFDRTPNQYQEACMLTAKGRVLDRLKIALSSPAEAYIMTSPRHSSKQLFANLDPLIFPMDQVKLNNAEDAFIFTLASTQWEHVQSVIQHQVLDKYSVDVSFPPTNQSLELNLDGSTKLLLLPSTGLPSVACVGYTLVFLSDNSSIGKRAWEFLISDGNAEGPIEVGALEYESLRIEVGQPAFDFEYIGSDKKKANTSPLELHWKRETINLDKGCYLGQEGVASVLKNARGPPRQLYSIAFEDDDNVYESESKGDKSKIENKTRPPRVGDAIYALGSNEGIALGKITSLAEPGGTGDSNIVGLALIKRADSILKQMRDFDIEINRPGMFDDLDSIGTGASGIIEPPPLDPLDGLEIIVEGSYTIGTLKMVPSRRFRRGTNMFEDSASASKERGQLIELDMQEEIEKIQKRQELELEELNQKAKAETQNSEVGKGRVEDVSVEAELARAEEEARQAQLQAEEASVEAKRKADKMEILKKRAEEAMAKRRKATEVTASSASPEETAASAEDPKLAEEKRKEEKMAMLKKRAEEAMARRKAESKEN